MERCGPSKKWKDMVLPLGSLESHGDEAKKSILKMEECTE